jgi:hypothetical protein
MTSEACMHDVEPGVLWPFLVAPKPPDGFSTVVAPAFLEGADLRGFVTNSGSPTTAEPCVTRASVQNKHVWLIYFIVQHARTELPPVGGGYRSGSTRPITVIEGCIVRAADRPTTAMIREATSSEAIRVYESEFLRFWTSDEQAGSPIACPPLEECIAGPPPPPAPVSVPVVARPPVSRAAEASSPGQATAPSRRYLLIGVAVLIVAAAIITIVWLTAGA